MYHGIWLTSIKEMKIGNRFFWDPSFVSQQNPGSLKFFDPWLPPRVEGLCRYDIVIRAAVKAARELVDSSCCTAGPPVGTCVGAREDRLCNEEHADCQVHQQLWLWQLLKSLGLPLARLWCSYEDLEMSSNHWAQVASLVDFFYY